MAAVLNYGGGRQTVAEWLEDEARSCLEVVRWFEGYAAMYKEIAAIDRRENWTRGKGE
jgi:hypothetical protein